MWIKRSAVVAVASTGIGFLFALPYILGEGTRESAVAIMINWWLWALALPLIVLFDGKLPFTIKQPIRLFAAHLVFGLMLTMAYVAVAASLEYALGLNKWEPWSHALGLLNWFLWATLVYLLMLGALQSQKYYRRYVSDELRLERLERRFVEAQLVTLRMQLDPHFLFNTLNGISTQVERNPKSARRMIEDLAGLLRLSLDPANRQDVPLQQEIGFVERYIAIQKMRFADRLKVEMAIAPGVSDALVPSLLLQPLVENAISHGISPRVTGGSIKVTAERKGDMVEIGVEDDGVGLPAFWTLEQSDGLGLKATFARVVNSSAHGDGRMSVERGKAGGTVVRISLPFRSRQEAAHATIPAE